MATPSRGARLVKRYPVLHNVPEDERASLVRSALMHPVVLLIILLIGFLVLPQYLHWMFGVLGIEGERNIVVQLSKLILTAFVPILLIVPAMTRFVMPHFIRKTMEKRGYSLENKKKIIRP